jgi:hypothetical membrane protein
MIITYLRRNYASFGLAGATVVSFCALVAALFYTGPDGEPYSVLNHFISELGEVGVSPLAGLFNLGLIASGLLLIPFCLGLGLALPGWLSKVGLMAGLATALSLSGVGVFPMNNLPAHITAALAYFRTGLATVILFGQAILFQPKEEVVLDRRVSLASLVAAACYAGFILYMGNMPTTGGTNALDPSFRSGRPAVWSLAVLEWLVFFSTILWFAAIALAGRKATQARAALTYRRG